ncbi:MAG: glycosyltransferase family 4 protein [Flavobacteriales bacterium]|nr:glycosyltransferase family 4 protein [Flavobacteriales bacterium]
MIRVTYIVSDIDKALAFEWISSHLNREDFDLRFILLNNTGSELEQYLIESGVPCKRIASSRGLKAMITFFQVWWELICHRPKVIHTHLRRACIIGLPAALMAAIPQRIHTRHHSTSNHIYHPHAVKTDKLITLLSTKVVAISTVVESVLVEKENTPLRKIQRIPHGFDLKYFERPPQARINKLREKYSCQNSTLIVGIVARYLELKGVEYGIRAFRELLADYPKAHLVLANAKGPYRRQIQEELSSLPHSAFTEIVFESDLTALFGLFDVYLHLPIQNDIEAFGQTYIEALAGGVPSVFTISGIGAELIRTEENAIVVPYKNSRRVYEAIKRILEDDEFRNKLVKNGRETVMPFGLKPFISRLEDLYRA